MAKRIDLIGKPKKPPFAIDDGSYRPPEEKRSKGEISIARAFEGFLLLCVIHAGVFALYFGWYYRWNYEALSKPIHSGKIGTNFCAKAFTFVPESMETAFACQLFNIMPFMVMPAIVLGYIGLRLIKQTPAGR